MQKYIAFGLYQKNELGGHAAVRSVLTGGDEVYLATDVEPLTALLDKLAYPERFPESGHDSWHHGDGPFEDWASQIAKEYRSLMVK